MTRCEAILSHGLLPYAVQTKDLKAKLHHRARGFGSVTPVCFMYFPFRSA